MKFSLLSREITFPGGRVWDGKIFSLGVLPSCHNIKKAEQSQGHLSARLSRVLAGLWTPAWCLGSTGSWVLLGHGSAWSCFISPHGLLCSSPGCGERCRLGRSRKPEEKGGLVFELFIPCSSSLKRGRKPFPAFETG